MEDSEIIKLVENYRAPERAIEIVKQMKIALVAGITGAGKNTIQNKLLEESNDYADIVTTIPRAPRPHEQNGVDYYFINNEIALDNLINQRYFETKIVHGRVYGTTIAELERISELHKIALADVDVQGVDEYYDVAGDDLTAFFLIPPDYTTWQKRLFSRGELPAEEFTRRVRSAIMEIKHALDRDYYHFVVNDDLGQATRLIDKIVREKDANYDDTEARKTARALLDDIVANLA
ncbi:MAG: hypothetical protein LBM09_00585 [Candidatus Nomurabacteria bacterium]|jgi:guanylate kinase|nr:hypothetical protein [Candidatus Nomurabacteria bacterium]